MRFEIDFDVATVNPLDAPRATRAIVSRLWVFFVAMACFFLLVGFLVGYASNACPAPRPPVTRDRTT